MSNEIVYPAGFKPEYPPHGFTNPLNSRAPVLFASVTDSTMNAARACPDELKMHGMVFRTDFQTGGRGRFSERKWDSEPGDNLLFTVLLSREITGLNAIPVRTGLGVARALETYCPGRVSIKWPNDILVDGRKICGILCESGNSWIYAGIGININQEFFQGAAFRTRPTSLFLSIHEKKELSGILHVALKSLEESLHDESWASGVNSRLAWMNCTVSFESGAGDNTVQTGILRGITPEGALRVEQEHGESVFYAGEVSHLTAL